MSYKGRASEPKPWFGYSKFSELKSETPHGTVGHEERTVVQIAIRHLIVILHSSAFNEASSFRQSARGILVVV